MTVEVVPWTTVGEAMRQYVIAATTIPDARVVWGEQNDAPQPGYPYAVLSLSGLRYLGNVEHRRDEQTMVDLVTILAASAQTYTVTVDAVAYAYAAGGGDSLTDIRDALVTALGALADISVAASGTAALTLTGSTDRPTFHTTTTPAVDLTRVSTTDGICERLYWPAEVTLFVDIRSDQTVPRLGSRTLAERLPIGAEQNGNRTALKVAGTAFYRVLGMTDLTGLISADMESRTVADLAFGLGPQAAEDLNWVNTITATPDWT